MDEQLIKEQLEEIESIKKVRELAGKVNRIKTAMLTTADISGQPRSRPMHTHQMQDDGVIWFFTGKDTHTAKEVTANPMVNLSYTDPGSNLYISVNGIASLTSDPHKVDELWVEMLRAWFPKGKNDPNLTLLRVDVTEAEYWDAPDSIVSQLISVVKATLKGNPYKIGENKKVDLQ